MYFWVASSTDSTLNTEACTCSLNCSACVQKTLHMAMQISKCCGPISSGLYLQLWCTLAFVWQVCGTQTALCPAQKPQGGARSWSWALPLGIRLCKHKTILQDLGKNSSPHCQQPPSVSWRPGERQPPKVSQPHGCSRSLPVVPGEVLLLLQMWEGVHTPEIGPYMPDCKKPALVTHYPESAGWLSDSL